ncbi:MAG: sulfoxide reductase heme-binding subunit YedZ [Candidimonas sp.]|nr:MAG: sulfoxide reductase heme-binding subunit YedZ [Candidimonas sp.]
MATRSLTSRAAASARRGGIPRIPSICTHACGLFPLLRWVVLAWFGGLGVNPQEFLIRSSGIWALALLWATLAVTPLRWLTGQGSLVRQRRKLGLYAFFYTVLHVLAWAVWDRGGAPAAMWTDLWQRDFIGVGALAVLCLVPLAATSTQGWIRRLGRGWKRLHLLIYPAACLSVLHFDWMRAGKNDFLEPRVYAAILALLLGYRVVHRWRRSRPLR